MIRGGKEQGWLSLPIETLPSWALLNDVTFNGVTVGLQRGREDRGSTVIARKDLTAEALTTPLIVVPRDLILSMERVRKHAKYDRDFREVIEALGEFGRVSFLSAFQ